MWNFLDIDECISNPCHTNAECKDDINSYTCKCKEGFAGNGNSCTGIICMIYDCLYNKAIFHCLFLFTELQYWIYNIMFNCVKYYLISVKWFRH